MDLSNPLRSVTHGVEADVLAVLSRSHTPLTGADVQRLSDRSYGRVRTVLHQLTDHGLVDAERHGNAITYLLNRAHVLAAAIVAAAEANNRLEDLIRAAIEGWNVAPFAALVFGSLARRDGDATSDIDIMLVRPDDTDADADRWSVQRYALARQVERWSGNASQVLEMSATEFDQAIARNDDLIVELRQSARVVFGPPLRNLLGFRGDVGSDAP